MRRFFVDENAITDGTATISGNLFCHMSRVLRLKIGTRVILSDGIGRRHSGYIEQIGKENLVIRIEESSSEPARPAGPLMTLYQGLPKGSKMEFILQKSTELGVDVLAPFAAGRSAVRLPAARESQRLERWQRIIREAARQSNRTTVPQLETVADFSGLLAKANQTVKLLLWEEEKSNRLRSVLGSFPVPESVSVIVGPEGGLTRDEAASAMASGFLPVTLGSRILRTETAGLAILAILQYYWGDMG
ncbi:MAG: 16S rRNA (uracil(1498)-N(3))-methyltransferase [Geobacteraceae bacterium]|nr:16S rRNA (uracil(1498)-N(3))-methyltransferase [Geobacteraceae bacterium]